MIYVWIILYGLTHLCSETISQRHPALFWLVPSSMLLYTVLLILWICRTRQAKNIGLCAPSFPLRTKWLYLLPLVLFPVHNLLTSKGFVPDLSTAALMLSVSVVEEIFFRGFLLRYVIRCGKPAGIILTSLLFSLFHIVNLIQGAPSSYTFLQMLWAFAAGLCYCTAAISFDSLIPCITAHFLTNITAGPPPTQFYLESTDVWICGAVYVCWALVHRCILCNSDKEI